MKNVVKARETVPADELVRESFGLIELVKVAVKLGPAVQIGDGDRKGLALSLIGEELNAKFHILELDELQISTRRERHRRGF